LTGEFKNKKYRAMQVVAPGVLEMTEQPITTQAGCYRFVVVDRELIRKSWRTIPLFCISECPENCGITGQKEVLSRVYLMTPGAPGAPASAGHAQHPTHGFDAEPSLMLFDTKERKYLQQKIF
jgi:hypothetical protein